jgi:hypothetical protein
VTHLLRPVRLAIAVAALGLAAFAAPSALAGFTPEAGHYVDPSNSHGHRITFDYAAHAGTVHDFKLSSVAIFSSATVHHTTSGWHFSHYDSHYIVHGTWLNHWTVHGSICNLHIDPTGCRTSGKQSFEAVFPHAKPPEGPWTGTASDGGGASFTIGPSNSDDGKLALIDITISGFFSSRQGPLVQNSEGVWHFYRDDTARRFKATWTDTTHMHGHACEKSSYSGLCDPAQDWTFTAHYVGHAN